jgi:hypothetical protein
MKPRPDVSGLIHAKRAADERKFKDVDLNHRIMSAPRQKLELESDTLGIAHADISDEALRQSLITWHRNVAKQPSLPEPPE